jgi:hypothetical protein
VEVGGFIPNVRVNPPAAEIEDLAASHAEFARWLAMQGPTVSIAGTEVEARGDDVFLITAVIQNTGYFPTATAMGLRARTAPPTTVRLTPTDQLTVLSSSGIQQQIRNLGGSGGRATVTWLVQAPEGTQVRLEVLTPQGGGLKTTTLTLGQEDR